MVSTRPLIYKSSDPFISIIIIIVTTIFSIYISPFQCLFLQITANFCKRPTC